MPRAGTATGTAGHGARRTVRPGDRGPARAARGHGQDPCPPGPDRDAEGADMSGEHASMRIIEGYARGAPERPADRVGAVEAHREVAGVWRDRLPPPVGVQAPAVASLVDT